MDSMEISSNMGIFTISILPKGFRPVFNPPKRLLSPRLRRRRQDRDAAAIGGLAAVESTRKGLI
jgi:hypothetical protein